MAYDAKAIELYGPAAKTNFNYEPRPHIPRCVACDQRVDSPADSISTDSEITDDYDVVVLPLRKNLSPLIHYRTMMHPPLQTIALPAPSPLAASIEPITDSALNRSRSKSLSNLRPVHQPIPSMMERVNVGNRPTSHSWDCQKPLRAAKKASSPIGTKQARKMEAFNKLKLKLLDSSNDDCQSIAFECAIIPAASPVHLNRTSACTTSETAATADDDCDMSNFLDLSLLSCGVDMSIDEINISESLFDNLTAERPSSVASKHSMDESVQYLLHLESPRF